MIRLALGNVLDCGMAKTCKKCGVEYAVEADGFYRHGKYFARTCKRCESASAQEWSGANLERRRAADRRFYANHREKRKAFIYAWKAENRAYARDWWNGWHAKKMATDSLYRDKRTASSARRRHLLDASGEHFNASDVRRQFVLQSGRCFWCDVAISGTRYHVDHLIPVARGGGNGPANIVIACPTCNRSKNASPPLDWAPNHWARIQLKRAADAA